MSQFQRSTKAKKKLLFPRPVLVVVLFIAFLFLASSVIQLVRKEIKIRAEVHQLQTQQQELTKKQTNLDQDIRYLSTDEGKEQALRDKYRLVKPGEHIIVVTDPPPPSDAQNNKNQSFFSRFFDAIKHVFSKQE